MYDHDDIHRVMKHQERPAYDYFKADKAEVMTSRALFDNLPLTLRLYAVLEETYVLALERSQIPFRGQVSPHQSFLMALQKVCTSITSGWFREFAWEHYYLVEKLYNPSYASIFWDQEPTVKRFNESSGSGEPNGG